MMVLRFRSLAYCGLIELSITEKIELFTPYASIIYGTLLFPLVSLILLRSSSHVRRGNREATDRESYRSLIT